MDLRGRRVLITGASSGVGAAAGLAFADAGCDVALTARSGPGLEEVARRVRARGTGARVLVLPCDLRDPDAVTATVARVDADWGGLDVLVPNAATALFGPFATADPEDFEAVIETNLVGNVRVVRAALPLLERSGGTIVATGSLNARSPLPDWSSYAASKHGLRGFYNTLRVELKASGSDVTVSQVHPGAIATPVWDVSTSTIGTLPRKPPWGYRPEVVADALVACARKPRKEAIPGLEAKLFDLAWRSPARDLIMGIVHRYYLTGRRSAPRPGALTEPTNRGDVRGSMLARPSLTARLRFRS